MTVTPTITHTPQIVALVTTKGPAGYRLLDTGNGRKLERFGNVVVDRPEPQAMWQPGLPQAAWAKANAAFSASSEDEEKGKWRINKPVPEGWPVEVEDVTIKCRLAGLWHLGLFPEQVPHWQWMTNALLKTASAPATGPSPTRPAEPLRVLNLFGYTGAASLIAAKAGAEVVHVDASKKAIQWARENQSASRMENAPIRWICEDARKFVAREVRRGRTYHSILIDPPKFGRGPDGEVWDLFTDLPALLSDCARLADIAGSHIILTAYAIRASSLALDGLMHETMRPRGGTIESGELALSEESGRRILGTSLFSRWSST